jgi:hypothetical protein
MSLISAGSISLDSTFKICIGLVSRQLLTNVYKCLGICAGQISPPCIRSSWILIYSICNTEPVFVNLLRNRFPAWWAGIRQSYLTYRPNNLIGWRNRFLEIDSWGIKRLKIRAQPISMIRG